MKLTKNFEKRLKKVLNSSKMVIYPAGCLHNVLFRWSFKEIIDVFCVALLPLFISEGGSSVSPVESFVCLYWILTLPEAFLTTGRFSSD